MAYLYRKSNITFEEIIVYTKTARNHEILTVVYINRRLNLAKL